MLVLHLNEFTTVIDGDQAIMAMHNGHGIVALLALRDFTLPVCEEWFTQCLHAKYPCWLQLMITAQGPLFFIASDGSIRAK